MKKLLEHRHFDYFMPFSFSFDKDACENKNTFKSNINILQANTTTASLVIDFFIFKIHFILLIIYFIETAV